MSTDFLRLAVAVTILGLLARAAIAAWRQRAVTVAIWRGLTWRHVTGAGLLLVVVATIASFLLALAPLRIGLGTLVGFLGNVVFAPLQEVALRSAGPAAGGPDWRLAGLATVFLAFLGALLPWLAFVEEEVFRAGLETADLPRQLWVALKFGLLHMVMLIPVGAALAIAVAGFAYGRIYRRAWRRGDLAAVPLPVRRVYRPSRRAALALASLRRGPGGHTGDHAHPAGQRTPRQATHPLVGAAATEPSPVSRQVVGVYTATMWHTAFNSLVVGLLWVTIVVDALLLGTGS